MFLCYEILKNAYVEEYLVTAASELTLESDYLELCFWSVILQKHQSLSSQNSIRNSAHMSPLNMTPTLSFQPRFCMFIINSSYTKSISPWTPSCDMKLHISKIKYFSFSKYG